MNCVYCFNNRRTHEKKKVMTIDTVKKVFSSTIPYYKKIKFIWHGGEPLSMGIDFYKEIINLQKSMNKYGTEITNSIQSNLTLLDEEFASFLVSNNFKIGGSFDGTTNELTRHNTAKILSGRDFILNAGGSVGFICVVQSKNVDYLIEDYCWFKEHKINYTINPYLSDLNYENDELFVPSEHYIKRICSFFDFWQKDKECNINISFFNDYIDYILFGIKKLCCYNSCLGKHVGIHYNGDIYNCNRNFSEDLCYGNIYDCNDIRECFNSPGFEAMLKHAITRRNWCKDNCEIYDFCSGGCNSCSQASGNLSKINPYVCDITQSVYNHIEKRLKEITINDLDNINPYLSDKIRKYYSGSFAGANNSTE